MNEIKVLNVSSEAVETKFTVEMEYEGEEYTVNLYSSDHNSYTEWDKGFTPISCPEWAKDLDVWELYSENEGKE
jgi:hypothetical protein